MFTDEQLAEICVFRRYLETKGYRYLATGGQREVWVNKAQTRVVKIPLLLRGTVDNHYEAITQNDRHARCRIMRNSLLVMEYVKPLESKKQPEWASCEFYCCQVGITRKGKAAAYDYGYF